jgi:Fic family protein
VAFTIHRNGGGFWKICNVRGRKTDPMAKAVFMMFMISEVHPFTDGNGRILRIMGNAELFKSGLSRIIVPTVYREDYMMSLKKFTNRKEPDTYIRVMDKLQYFSNNIFGENFDELNNYFKATNAYKEPSEGKLNIIDRSVPDINWDNL